MAELLLDTHLLLWAAFDAQRLSRAAQMHLTEPANTLYFSPISIWEVAIKFLRNRRIFEVDPRVLRQTLLANGLSELAVRDEHAIATLDPPPIHKEPFDRILIAQALAENLQLLTADSTIAQYPGPILQV